MSQIVGALAILVASTMPFHVDLAHASARDGFAHGLIATADRQGEGQQLTGTDRAVGNDEVMLAKADRSFSEFPLGTDRNDALDLLQLQLREIIENDCDLNGTCDWLIASAPHVRHRFDENGLVESKHIIVDDYGNGEIRALGIGNERITERVIDNIIAFLPGVEITCLSVDEAGEGEGRSSCGGSIGEAHFKLIFADTDILQEVHLYRYSGI